MRYLTVTGCVLMATVCGLSALATATVMTAPSPADWTIAAVNVVGVVVWAFHAASLTVVIIDGECD